MKRDFITLAAVVAIIMIASVLVIIPIMLMGSYQKPTEWQAGTITHQKCTAFLGFCWDGGYADTVVLVNGTTIIAGDSCEWGGWGEAPLPMASNFSYTPHLGWAQASMECM